MLSVSLHSAKTEVGNPVTQLTVSSKRFTRECTLAILPVAVKSWWEVRVVRSMCSILSISAWRSSCRSNAEVHRLNGSRMFAISIGPGKAAALLAVRAQQVEY
jgi:hypothetical protein